MGLLGGNKGLRDLEEDTSPGQVGYDCLHQRVLERPGQHLVSLLTIFFQPVPIIGPTLLKKNLYRQQWGKISLM